MISRNSKRKWFFLVAAAMVMTALVLSGFSARRQQPKQQHAEDWLSSLPPVQSKVKDLEIINLRIVGRAGEAQGVAFEIRNNSNRGVMAVDITSGESGVSKDGLEDEENPVVIIEPHGTLTAEMTDELTRDAPIVISAATFADGTEEGSNSSLQSIHRARLHVRPRHAAAFGGV
jgi:hypothetical protein